MKTSLKKYLTEFVGTFFLVLTVGSVILLGSPAAIPALAIGAVLMVMVYAGGYISGGHYNPAVSIAAWIRGALPMKHMIMYWIAQVLGGLAAAMAVICMTKNSVPVMTMEFDTMTLLICEFLFTFALAYVVLHTATTILTEGNSYYGLAIGAAVMVGIFAFGAISPAAFNPAVALGLGMMTLISAKTVMWTILANLLGGVMAALVFKMTTVDCRN